MEFGWIDFSKQDKANAINVINSLGEKGVLDELGFSSVRSAFADSFFPGTSTIQTRAKYFLLVPYILQDYISAGHTITNDINGYIKQAQEKIDKDERRTGRNLMSNCKTDPQSSGIIGARSIAGNQWVERTPVSIYWNGLRTFKFFRTESMNFTYTDFLYSVYRLEKNKTNARNSENTDKDDKNDVDAGNYSKKSPLSNIPTYRRGWEKDVDIQLTEEESAFLKEKIILAVGDSLFGILLKENIDISSCPDFESFSKLIEQRVSPEMNHKIYLANSFNEFFYLTMLRYSFKLSKGEDPIIQSEWNLYKSKIKNICDNLDIDDLFETMKIINPKLKIFMKGLWEAFYKNDIDKADELIKAREYRLKTTRAKLSMENYTADEYPLFGKFDYRFRNAKQLIIDIKREVAE